MYELQEACCGNRKLSHREIIWNILIKLLKLISEKEIKPETGLIKYCIAVFLITKDYEHNEMNESLMAMKTF